MNSVDNMKDGLFKVLVGIILAGNLGANFYNEFQKGLNQKTRFRDVQVDYGFDDYGIEFKRENKKSKDVDYYLNLN